jgi:hypothetical protein
LPSKPFMKTSSRSSGGSVKNTHLEGVSIAEMLSEVKVSVKQFQIDEKVTGSMGFATGAA